MIQIKLSGFLRELAARRKSLKMPLDTLVHRSGVPRATVCRILKGDAEGVGFGRVAAVAEALGMDLEFRATPQEEFVEAEVQRRARKMADTVQGTMALESQGVTDPAVFEKIVSAAAQTIREKPLKKFWTRNAILSSHSR
jgi:transcriptional regulator with XRE-family HTH domain